MALENKSIVLEMNLAFERMHARLDQRFQQLVRQIQNRSQYQNDSNSDLVFCSLNEMQLDRAIASFGRLTLSTSLNDVSRLTNPTTSQYAIHSVSTRQRQPMRRSTTPVSTASNVENVIEDENCRVIGKRGRHRGQFSNPQDVLIVNNNSTLLVSDTINQNVQMFSLSTGNFTGGFLPPSDKKQIPLRRPIGLSPAFNHESGCLVADYDQHLIGIWTINNDGNGKLARKFGQQSLLGPKGLCMSTHSHRIAVADNKANCICLFESSGVFLHRFGTRGTAEHELAGPHYLTFADLHDDRQVIVTDFNNSSVKIFDVERHGQLVTSFGSNGTKPGQFQASTGLAIDHERGLIFVSDWGNNRIQVFDRQGAFVRIVSLPSNDTLYGPQGLDYAPGIRTLAVANSGKHCALLIHID